jgi:rhodanese-related sulfurtransferase
MEEVDVVTARSLQEQGAQLVDVREPHEYAGWHATGAVNIPLSRLEGRLDEIRRDGTVLLICQGGYRSAMAQEILARHNITDTRNVAGGTDEWYSAGLPMT